MGMFLSFFIQRSRYISCHIFFANLDRDLEDYVVEYYKMFPPEELGDPSEGISTMLLKHNIYQRGMTTVDQCVKEGFIRKEDAEDFNEMVTFIYEATLSKVMKGKINYDEAVEKLWDILSILQIILW